MRTPVGSWRKQWRCLCQRRKETKENVSADESEEPYESERGGRNYPLSTRQDTRPTHICTPVNVRTVHADFGLTDPQQCSPMFARDASSW